MKIYETSAGSSDKALRTRASDTNPTNVSSIVGAIAAFICRGNTSGDKVNNDDCDNGANMVDDDEAAAVAGLVRRRRNDGNIDGSIGDPRTIQSVDDTYGAHGCMVVGIDIATIDAIDPDDDAVDDATISRARCNCSMLGAGTSSTNVPGVRLRTSRSPSLIDGRA